jgi:predicted helicase
LKLSQFLQDKGYRMQPDERLQIYLTNTLERAELRPVQYSLALVPALSKEIKEAQKIKEKPILVITGNPPYSGHSKNPSERKVVDTTNSQKIRIKREKTFIGDLIETYKHVDGEKLKENSKWLQNDYVKFIRFAQWKMESVEEGIVGIITDHSFLDNPTFRGMRQSLMQSFNQIYLLDLHGNARKKEKTPEGSKDENVFDIEQGVAISLLVKQKGLSRAIYHADLWGMRKDKYRALLEAKRDSLEWQKLTPNMPSYLFIPQNEELREEYEQGWNLKDIFIVNNSGIVSKRDAIAFHFRQEDLRGVLDDFYSLEEQILKEKYNFKESRDGKINFVKKHIRDYGIKDEYIRLCLYRPFDCRWTYHTNKSKGFLGWPVYEIMHHMFSRENVGLGVSKGKEASGVWGHIFCTNQIIQHHTVSLKEINYLFPLYLYPPQEGEKKLKTHWFEESDPFELYGDPAHGNRIENLSPAFRQFVNTHYSYAYSPEEILGYIYAVLHSPTYRERYLEFLKIDFPRISLVDKREIFEALSKLGCELVQAHLLKSIPEEPKVDVTKGEFEVEKPTYNAQHERLYINKEQHFSPVSQDVWDFHIGGYQVLNKYLKSRIGRALSLDEIENVQNAIKVLGFTQRQMQKIEKIWQSELL